jgi:ribosome biogenesis GTPase A
MAGLDIGSDAAAEVLQSAKASADVIRGVNALASSFSLDKSGEGKNDAASNGEQLDSNVGEKVPVAAEGGLVVDSNYYLNRKEHYASLQRNNSSSKSGKNAALLTESENVCICQRCFRLQTYGQVEESLRPGWSSNELLTPERFEGLLSSIKDTEAVVLCIIDVFDLQGSLLANLRQIAGRNPIVIAANKVDLLPTDVSESRLIGWIHSEVKQFCGLVSPRDREEKSTKEFFARGWSARLKENDFAGVLSRNNVHLVSCQSGYGMEKLMRNLITLAGDNGQKVYVMGAANVGKSSFINRLLNTNYQSDKKTKSPKKDIPQATVSNLPGTTLDFIKIRLPNGITMIDTPGLINKGQLTSRLTLEELKQVIPIKPINAITLRVTEGKCILLGALAKVELLDVSNLLLLIISYLPTLC